MRCVLYAYIVVSLAFCQDVCDSKGRCTTPEQDVTSLLQKTIQRHTKGQGAHMEGQAKREKVCRLIGAGGKAPEPANIKAAEVMKTQNCQVIDWDGDPIDRRTCEGYGCPVSDAEGGRTFASALRNEYWEQVTKPTLSPHCVPEDCDYPPGTEEAVKSRETGGKYFNAGVQMVLQTELTEAAKVIKEKLGPGALTPEDKNFPKYLGLAIADRLATRPEVVIWQMDNERAPDKYWNWVSLAEYVAMKNVQPETVYILINNQGVVVPEAVQPWESMTKESLHFGTELPVGDQPLEPIMPHEEGDMPEAETPMSME